MKKTILSFLYIGFTLGFILGVSITAMIVTAVIGDGSLHLYTSKFTEEFKNPVTAFIIHSTACGILGMIMTCAAAIYEIEEWDLLKATIVHFLVIVSSFYGTAFFLRWFGPENTKAVCTSFIMFILIYTGIWLCQYLTYKAQIREINQRLMIKKKSQANI